MPKLSLDHKFLNVRLNDMISLKRLIDRRLNKTSAEMGTTIKMGAWLFFEVKQYYPDVQITLVPNNFIKDEFSFISSRAQFHQISARLKKLISIGEKLLIPTARISKDEIDDFQKVGLLRSCFIFQSKQTRNKRKSTFSVFDSGTNQTLSPKKSKTVSTLPQTPHSPISQDDEYNSAAEGSDSSASTMPYLEI